jgi:hypothetical protein
MVIISRTSQISNKFVPIQIYIDGVNVGSLTDGERAEFRVTPGEHVLEAKLNISVSNVLKFEAPNNRNIEFELGSNVNVMKNVLIMISHPAILISLYFLDKIIKWDYFLLFGFLVYLTFEAWVYFVQRKKNKATPAKEIHYLYLKPVVL